jgi:putative chitinase
MITSAQIKSILPHNKNPDQLAEALNHVLPLYDINNKERVACFLAHESGEFNILRENLNYSAESLCKVWPKRFPSASAAQPYNRNPEKIANKVYADRLGNGSEATGDGFKYRGRGAIQLTGKCNYEAFAKSIGKKLDETVAYCETLEGAIASACFFWKTNNLNKFVDAADFLGLTKKINGGTIGLEDRKKHYKKALEVLGEIKLAPVAEAKAATPATATKPATAPAPAPVKTEEPKGEPDLAAAMAKYFDDAVEDVTDALNDVGNAINSWFK